MDRDRSEDSINEQPDLVAEQMTGATQRLRRRAWMIAGLTRPVVSSNSEQPIPRGRMHRSRST